jgi:hypothetical protein
VSSQLPPSRSPAAVRPPQLSVDATVLEQQRNAGPDACTSVCSGMSYAPIRTPCTYSTVTKVGRLSTGHTGTRSHAPRHLSSPTAKPCPFGASGLTDGRLRFHDFACGRSLRGRVHRRSAGHPGASEPTGPCVSPGADVTEVMGARALRLPDRSRNKLSCLAAIKRGVSISNVIR